MQDYIFSPNDFLADGYPIIMHQSIHSTFNILPMYIDLELVTDGTMEYCYFFFFNFPISNPEKHKLKKRSYTDRNILTKSFFVNFFHYIFTNNWIY